MFKKVTLNGTIKFYRNAYTSKVYSDVFLIFLINLWEEVFEVMHAY